ncbi:MAG: LamG domain-containing protein [Planctomycetota bacterium]
MKKLLILILALGVATASFAVDKLSIKKFGGLVTRTNPFELQDSESPDMSNFVLDEAGTLTRRPLFQRYNTTSIGNIAFTNLYKFYTSADAGYMILSGGTNLYKATGGTLTSISVSANTVVSDSQWAFESFTDGANEVVFGANNNIPLKLWNGSAATFYEQGGTPGTNCNILRKHKSRLWAAGSKTYPYRIYYSSLSDGDNWITSGGSMDLGAYEKIMALEVLSDTLFIFTRTGIYALLGDTPQEFAIQKTRSTVGTHAFKSVVLGNKLIYFLNKSGVFVFDGDESVNISETIQPTVDSISATYISNSASLFDKRGRLWLSYTSMNGSFNDSLLVYDTVLKQWYPLNNVNFSAFFKAEGGADKGEIYATCSNPVGDLWKFQTSTSIENIVHSTQTQLLTGVTFNTVIANNPVVALPTGGYDNYTTLLAHFNGTNGGTYTPAETGQVLTYVGTAQLSTTEKVFGSASLLLDGNSDCVTVPSSANICDFGAATGDFSLECRVSLNSIALTQALLSIYDGAGNGWRLYIGGAGSGLLLKNTDATTSSIPWVPSVNTWYHVAVARSGTIIRAFINGVSIGTFTNSDFSNPMNHQLEIGSGDIGNLDLLLNGYIDEVRISKGIARWTSNFSPTVSEYTKSPAFGGTLTSANLQINANGQLSLGTISWQEYLPSNTDIQFTTRTGTTSDTVFYNGWQTWVSSNVVTCNTVTNPTVWTNQSPLVFSAKAPLNPQGRDVLYYETNDSVSPNCVQFDVSRGTVSMNHFSDCIVPAANLSNDKFMGYWLKSPCTGNSVKLDIGEVTGVTVGYTTANTVNANTWEFHYWPLTYTSTDLDDIKYMRITYLGDVQGELYLGDVSAYDFLDNDETITSTPNDWIQYKAILGSNSYNITPRLLLAAGYVIKLSYSSSAGASETSLNSFWSSKPFDGGDASKNKLWQYLTFQVESQNPTTGHTVQLYYETDDGRQSGTLSKTVDVTGRTTNLKFYLPTGTYGRNFKFKFIDDNLNDELKVKNAEIFVIPEGGN